MLHLILMMNTMEDSNEKHPKFKVGDRTIVSRYKNIFAKEYIQIGQKTFLSLAKLKIPFHGLMLLVI